MLHPGITVGGRITESGVGPMGGATVEAPLDAPWQEALPGSDVSPVYDVTAFANHLVVLERTNSGARTVVHDLRSGTAHPVQFTEQVHSVRLPSQLEPEFQLNLESSSTVPQLFYSSFAIPRSVVEYGMEGASRRLVWQERVRGLDSRR